tara:strand:- start:1970 stop:3859 length:1890 start_codon:yes stop_codon:yes gene_type:complete
MTYSKRKNMMLLSAVWLSLLSVMTASLAAAYTSQNDYPYKIPVSVLNSTGATYTGMACAELNAQQLVSGGFMNTDSSDYRVQKAQTFPIESFLSSTSSTDACAWLPVKDVENNFTQDFSIYTGITTAPMDQYGVWGSSDDLASVSYDAALNPSNKLHIKASSVTAENTTDIVNLGTSYRLGITSSGYPYVTVNDAGTSALVEQTQQNSEQTLSASGDILGNTFTTSGATNISSVEIYTKYISGSGTQFQVGIYAVDGTGAPLVGGLVGSRANINLGTNASYSFTSATFSPAISVSGSTQYGVVVTSDAAGNEVHRWGYQNSDVLAGGKQWWDTSPSGGTWSGAMDSSNASRDRTFKVYESVSPVTIVGNSSVADAVHDFEVNLAASVLDLRINGAVIGTASVDVPLSTVTDDLIIASRTADGIRSMKRLEIGTSAADADNELDLTFTPLTLTRTQAGKAAHHYRWVYSISDASAAAQTASMTIVSNTITVDATTSPLTVTPKSTAPVPISETLDPWGTSFGGAIASPVQDGFVGAANYKWPLRVIQPSFDNGGVPLALGAAFLAAVFAIFFGGAALLLTRIPAFGMMGALIGAVPIVWLTPLPNVLMIMMFILTLAVGFLLPRFWESNA